METFIIYRIITKTSREEFDSSDFEVGRCYQDFLWLKEKLEEAHPTLIIPVCLLFFFHGIAAILSCESLECLNTQFQTFDSVQSIYLGNICF